MRTPPPLRLPHTFIVLSQKREGGFALRDQHRHSHLRAYAATTWSGGHRACPLPWGRLPARLRQNLHPTCGTWLPQREGQTPPTPKSWCAGELESRECVQVRHWRGEKQSGRTEHFGKSESSILGHLWDTLHVNMAQFTAVGKRWQCSWTTVRFFAVDFSTEIEYEVCKLLMEE